MTPLEQYLEERLATLRVRIDYDDEAATRWSEANAILVRFRLTEGRMTMDTYEPATPMMTEDQWRAQDDDCESPFYGMTPEEIRARFHLTPYVIEPGTYIGNGPRRPMEEIEEELRKLRPHEEFMHKSDFVRPRTPLHLRLLNWWRNL